MRERHLQIRSKVWLLICAAVTSCGGPDNLGETVNRALVVSAAPQKELCAPGDEISCQGPSGCAGSRACTADGAGFGACYCRADCASETAMVHVIATSNVLYRFDPRSVVFSEVGPLSCSIVPMSMAVDRQGTAWVLSDEGTLHRVDVATGDCKPTEFVPGQMTFFKFGMGFVSNEPGGTEETLFIGGDDMLGTIDTHSLSVSLIAPWKLKAAELTGNADGRLFAFSGPRGRSVVDIDRATGALLRSASQSELGDYKTFAMAYWGGDFWLFTDARVNRYRPVDHTTTVVKTDIGFSVVGAGVSTCAPSE